MAKKIFRTAGYILLLIFAYMAFQVCFTFISMTVGVVYADLKGILSVDSLAQLAEYETLLSLPEANNIYIWSMSIGLFLSALAMLLFLYMIKGYRIRLNLLSSMSSRSLLYSTLLVFSSMFALNIFVQWFGLEDKLTDELGGIAHNVLGVITISLVAPLLEEVLFRGAIQGYMMRRYNPWVAIVSAALVFGIFHLNPVQVVGASIVGLLLAWLYWRTGSLMPGILIHIFNNSLSVYLALHFPEVDYVQDLMPTTYYVALLLVAFALLCYSLHVLNKISKKYRCL